MMFRERIATGVLFLALSSGADGAVNVNCDQGDSLQAAVSAATPGDTIAVTGVCYETVVIATDDLVVDGQGATILDAGNAFPPQAAISVEGARGVTLKGLDVRNGLMGISLKKGAHAALDEIVTRNQETMGLSAIEKSVLTVNSARIEDAGVNGVDIVEASNIKITGELSVSGSGIFSLNLQDAAVLTAENATVELENNTFGLHVAVGSTAFFNESSVHANQNDLIGVAVDNGSKLFMFSSHLQANGNGLDGIDCNINSNIDFDAASSATANDNGRNGISLEDTTFNVFSFFVVPGPSIEASNNGQNGAILTLGSKMDIGINSRFTASGNGQNGILVDDGSVVVLTNATVTGHGVLADNKTDPEVGDLRVTFGSRASAVGDTLIARTVCDHSALLRGGLKCNGPFITP